MQHSNSISFGNFIGLRSFPREQIKFELYESVGLGDSAEDLVDHFLSSLMSELVNEEQKGNKRYKPYDNRLDFFNEAVKHVTYLPKTENCILKIIHDIEYPSLPDEQNKESNLKTWAGFAILFIYMIAIEVWFKMASR